MHAREHRLHPRRSDFPVDVTSRPHSLSAQFSLSSGVFIDRRALSAVITGHGDSERKTANRSGWRKR